MMVWSNLRSVSLCFSAKVPQRLLSAIPNTTGKSICKTNFPMITDKPDISIPTALDKIRLIHNGVMNMPMRLEMLALNMAAGRLPPAMETITTDEDTVDGNAAI